MSLPITPIAYNPPTIAQEAAAKAAAGSGKRKIPAGVISDLARKSRKVASEFQDQMQKHVKKKLDSMTGSQDNRKVGLKVSQFIPGKGLEVPGAQQSKDVSIYCSLGLKGESAVDCWDKFFSTIKGKQISQDFAFKLICDPALGGRVKNSRAVTFNCFRHYNPDSYNYRKTGFWEDVKAPAAGSVHPSADQKKESNRKWHSTLGPDASYIRRSVVGLTTSAEDAGTWRGDDNSKTYATVGGMSVKWDATSASYLPTLGEANVANSLVSPFRTPYVKELMYSRVNRQVLENYGFNLNPFKLDSRNVGQTWSDYDASLTPMRVYGSIGPKTMNFGKQKDTLNNTDESSLASSFPAKINNKMLAEVSSDFEEHSPVYEYHSQLGPGKLNYQFCNDGTNPVCIDICVIGVKKSECVPLADFANIAKYNYAINKFISADTSNVAGYNTLSVDEPETIDVDLSSEEWCTDAKLPFIPNECFRNPQSYIQALSVKPAGVYEDLYTNLEQGKKNPFKVVKRDQFIVSSGASRSWTTTLPSIKYRPQIYESDVEYPLSTAGISNEADYVSTADEYTFMLAIGACGLAVPVEEVYPDSTINSSGDVINNHVVHKRAIMDRQASTCNVSVTGTYTETVQPCYVETVGSVNFINGRLVEPYFGVDVSHIPKIPINDNLELPNRLETVNIATQAQTVRTTTTGVTGVGAVTTQVGA